ncbi:hypothetical protein GOP47_0028501 [Adiantum capillus-veneris]|nr:hypothetical protein GOP47_0028501 [Adiantum capillus-veneris]
MKGKRVVSLVAAGCDILQALGCTHLLVGHDHVPCDAGDVGDLEVCTESTTGEVRSRIECEEAKLAMEALLWEAEFCRAGTAATLVEWALAPHRVILPKLKELKPDIIITQHQTCKVVSSACVEEAVEAFMGCKVDIIRLDLRRVNGIWEGISMMMQKAGLRDGSLLRASHDRICTVQDMCRGRTKRRVVYVQWDTSSYLCQGSMGVGTWVWDAIEIVGGINLLLEGGSGFNLNGSEVKPNAHFMDLDSILLMSPDVLILTNPMWGLKELYDKLVLHKQWLKRIHSSLPSLHSVAVHGPSFLSRFSPSLLENSIEALCEILHPECQPFGHQGSLWTTTSTILDNVFLT